MQITHIGSMAPLHRIMTVMRVLHGRKLWLTMDGRKLIVRILCLTFVYDNLTLIDTTTSRTRPHSVESVSNQLYVEFDTSKKGNEKYIGWKASFKTFVPITMEGSFNSPNYPNNYTAFQNITRYVHVPDDFGILFNILDFSSENGYDYLTITTDASILSNLTGSYDVFPFTIRTNASKATLLWHSDKYVTNRGFNLTYVADPNYT
uniref:CUB domain-containing protein n=1 Tax=Panagrellus redivivus TaxID=6233 RepID=A0A7E4V2Z7_PANRE